jgi:hypothetical protein
LGNYAKGGYKEEFMHKSRRLQLTPLLFDTGTSHWLAIPCFVFLLFGCSTLRSASPPPYVLSESETATVERGVLTATNDLSKPGFHDLKAAKNSNGDLYVCGWMDSSNKAYRTSEQAFIGTLSAGHFSPTGMGTTGDSNAEIEFQCQKLGMSIVAYWDNGITPTFSVPRSASGKSGK